MAGDRIQIEISGQLSPLLLLQLIQMLKDQPGLHIESIQAMEVNNDGEH